MSGCRSCFLALAVAVLAAHTAAAQEPVEDRPKTLERFLQCEVDAPDEAAPASPAVGLPDAKPAVATPVAPEEVTAAAVPPEPVVEARPAGSVEAPRAPEVAVQAAAPPDRPALRRAGWIAGGAGVGALLAGAFFGLQARLASNEVTDAARSGARFDPATEDRGKRAQTLQYVCYAAGAAAVLGGAFLLWLSPSPAPR